MNLSVRQYRNIDLAIMLIMLAAAEVLITVAARFWFPTELYSLSPTVAILCIVMMRWGPYAAVHAVGGGLALCIASGAEPKAYAVYCIGNCFALLALLLFKALGKEKIRSKLTLSLIFALTVFFAMQVGRWLVSLMFGGSLSGIVQMAATDSLSLVFAFVTIFIARRVDGLFEDQISYLIRTQSERKKESIPDEGDSEYNDM